MKRQILALAIVYLLALLAAPIFIDAKDKKPKEPLRTYPNTKTYESNCDTVWTAALPLLTEVGLAPQAMDRQGGFASFKWTKGQNESFSSKNDVRVFTTAYTGFWASYDIFRIDSGTMLVNSDGVGCRCQIKMVYAAYSATGFNKGWLALESNGFLEDTLLTKIGQQIKDRELAQAERNLKTPALTQPAPEPSKPGDVAKASVSISSTPPGADIEVNGNFVGNTPSKFDFAAGKRQIRISKPGHRSWMRSLDLLPGANITLAAELVEGHDEKNLSVSHVAPEVLAKNAAPEVKSLGLARLAPAVATTVAPVAVSTGIKNVGNTKSDGFLYREPSPSKGWLRLIPAQTPIEVIEYYAGEHIYKVKVGDETGYMLGVNLNETDQLKALKSAPADTPAAKR